jgi:hypothetical protein
MRSRAGGGRFLNQVSQSFMRDVTVQSVVAHSAPRDSVMRTTREVITEYAAARCGRKFFHAGFFTVASILASSDSVLASC